MAASGDHRTEQSSRLRILLCAGLTAGLLAIAGGGQVGQWAAAGIDSYRSSIVQALGRLAADSWALDHLDESRRVSDVSDSDVVKRRPRAFSPVVGRAAMRWPTASAEIFR